MLPSNGDGCRIYYKSRNQWAVETDQVDRMTIDNSGVSITNNLSITGDVNAAGGFAQSFVFVKSNLLQAEFAKMTASVPFISASNDAPVFFQEVPMVRAGSVRGLVVSVLNSTQTIKSGALSCSVMLNGANVACTAVGHTGTYIITTLAKDVVTFTAGQRIGVSMSASSLYLCEPDITSASFIATVLVEQ